MIEDKAVAVILSVYNGDKPKYLQLAIDSILCQSYSNIELNIGIDGPIDEDLSNILRKYEELPNVNLHYYARNRGLAAVLNDLIDDSIDKGFEYFARMDADDISMSNRLQLQMDFLSANPDIDVVGGAIDEIDENGQRWDKIIRYPETPEGCRKFFEKRAPHAHPAVLFRKSYFEKVKSKYRPDFRQDQDIMLWFDGLRNGTNHANIPDIILQYRLTDYMLSTRRNGLGYAFRQLKARLTINHTLGYGPSAYIFGFMKFGLLVSPTWIKKIAYKIFR